MTSVTLSEEEDEMPLLLVLGTGMAAAGFSIVEDIVPALVKLSVHRICNQHMQVHEHIRAPTCKYRDGGEIGFHIKYLP